LPAREKKTGEEKTLVLLTGWWRTGDGTSQGTPRAFVAAGVGSVCTAGLAGWLL